MNGRNARCSAGKMRLESIPFRTASKATGFNQGFAELPLGGYRSHQVLAGLGRDMVGDYTGAKIK